MRKGTERGYRSMDFTTNGERLASVGQDPDFMLTVWNWAQEKVILHCKAFGQDVSKVKQTHSRRRDLHNSRQSGASLCLNAMVTVVYMKI